MWKDQRTIIALAVPAAVCVVYGMVRADNPVFLVGLALGVAAYLLFRRRLKEDIREKYGERKKPPKEKETQDWQSPNP